MDSAHTTCISPRDVSAIKSRINKSSYLVLRFYLHVLLNPPRFIGGLDMTVMRFGLWAQSEFLLDRNHRSWVDQHDIEKWIRAVSAAGIHKVPVRCDELSAELKDDIFHLPFDILMKKIRTHIQTAKKRFLRGFARLTLMTGTCLANTQNWVNISSKLSTEMTGTSAPHVNALWYLV